MSQSILGGPTLKGPPPNLWWGPYCPWWGPMVGSLLPLVGPIAFDGIPIALGGALGVTFARAPVTLSDLGHAGRFHGKRSTCQQRCFQCCACR